MTRWEKIWWWVVLIATVVLLAVYKCHGADPRSYETRLRSELPPMPRVRPSTRVERGGQTLLRLANRSAAASRVAAATHLPSMAAGTFGGGAGVVGGSSASALFDTPGMGLLSVQCHNLTFPKFITVRALVPAGADEWWLQGTTNGVDWVDMYALENLSTNGECGPFTTNELAMIIDSYASTNGDGSIIRYEAPGMALFKMRRTQ